MQATMQRSIEQRFAIKFCVKLGKSPVKTFCMIKTIECSFSVTDIKYPKKYRSRDYDEQFADAKSVRETGTQNGNGQPKIAQT